MITQGTLRYTLWGCLYAFASSIAIVILFNANHIIAPFFLKVVVTIAFLGSPIIAFISFVCWHEIGYSLPEGVSKWYLEETDRDNYPWALYRIRPGCLKAEEVDTFRSEEEAIATKRQIEEREAGRRKKTKYFLK